MDNDIRDRLSLALFAKFPLKLGSFAAVIYRC